MTRRTAPAWIAACLVLALAPAALAQKGMGAVEDPDPTQAPSAPPKDVRPPAPAEPEKASVAIPYALTLLLGGAAVGLAVMPSSRTHQD
jgi:hypothetical protein